MLLHGLFRHFSGGLLHPDRELWDLACDMCVEFLIDDSWSRPVRTGRSRPDRDRIERQGAPVITRSTRPDRDSRKFGKYR